MENHTVSISNRELITITDIKEIDSFDEDEVRAALKEGAMIVKGRKLHLQLLDLNECKAVIAGKIDSVMYVKTKVKGEKGFFARLMK